MTETPKNITSIKDIPHVKEKPAKARKLFTFIGLNMTPEAVTESDMKEPKRLFVRTTCLSCGTSYDPREHDSCPNKPDPVKDCTAP